MYGELISYFILFYFYLLIILTPHCFYNCQIVLRLYTCAKKVFFLLLYTPNNRFSITTSELCLCFEVTRIDQWFSKWEGGNVTSRGRGITNILEILRFCMVKVKSTEDKKALRISWKVETPKLAFLYDKVQP